MKRRISDLLDGYLDDTVDLNADTPLSSQRIKERTMSKINTKTSPVRKGTRIITKILVAAAIISMLTMTAAAAERVFGVKDWFRDILNAQAKEDAATVHEEKMDITLRETVKENQLQKLEELGQVKNESVTSEGTTMTLTALYSDEYAMHLYFQVVAPEGTVLPDGMMYRLGGHGYPLEMDGEHMIYNMSMEGVALPDEDPTDNKKDIHVTIQSSLTNGFDGETIWEDAAWFNDSIPKKLHISGIFEQQVNGGEDTLRRITPGEFTFDITNPVTVRRAEVDVSGVETIQGHVLRQWNHDGPHQPWCPEVDENGGHKEEYDYTVTPTYLSIGPLTAEYAFDYTCTVPDRGVGLNFIVVMKDGTTTGLKHGGEMGCEGKFAGVSFFSTPIDLEEVDYILLGNPEEGNTQKVYLG